MIHLTIGELCSLLSKDGVNVHQQSILLGASALQIKRYLATPKIGCGIRVKMAAYKHVRIKGERVLIEPYTAVEQLEVAYELYRLEPNSTSTRSCDLKGDRNGYYDAQTTSVE